MTNKSNQTTWIMLFCLPFLFLAMDLGKYFADSFGERIIYSSVIAGSGGILGFGVFYLTRTSKLQIKIGSLFAIIVIVLLIGYYAKEYFY